MSNHKFGRFILRIGDALKAVGVVLFLGVLLSGCIAGGILGQTYVPWLSNFVDRETAYRVCMQEETNATVPLILWIGGMR